MAYLHLWFIFVELSYMPKIHSTAQRTTTYALTCVVCVNNSTRPLRTQSKTNKTVCGIHTLYANILNAHSILLLSDNILITPIARCETYTIFERIKWNQCVTQMCYDDNWYKRRCRRQRQRLTLSILCYSVPTTPSQCNMSTKRFLLFRFVFVSCSYFFVSAGKYGRRQMSEATCFFFLSPRSSTFWHFEA